MSILEQICEDKRNEIKQKVLQTPISTLEQQVKDAPTLRGFITKILLNRDNNKISLIAELKKASPSKGIIRWDFDIEEIVNAYEEAGASCLSVLTDYQYFQGKDEYLKRVREISKLPILRKDFIIDVYQVYESRVLGADCILLIMAALTDSQAQELYNEAKKLDLDVLVEVHDLNELQRALALGAQLIGINNRDLNTLDVNLNTSLDLIGALPSTILKVSESGIKSNDDIKKLSDSGFNAVLVGESLMEQDDIAGATRKLLGQT
jgi:indole-3-glycerol phosphate synthase